MKSARIFTKILIALPGIFFAHQAAAVIAPDTKQIKVIISPAVLKKVEAVNVEERKSLEDAIDLGNQFVPLHFSGRAYDTDPNNDDWAENTEPLIAPTREEWANQWGASVHRKKIRYGGVDADVTRLTCSQISLIGVDRDAGKVSLFYRTTSLGMEVNYRGLLFDFTPEGTGTNYDLRIDIDANNRVAKVIYPDELDAQAYVGDIAFMKAILSDHTRAGAVTKDEMNELIRTYTASIQKIEKQAAQVCR